MKKMYSWLSLLGISMVFCLVSGCKVTQPPPTTPAQPPPVKIGAILPMSGEFKKYGKDLLFGINLKIDEINAAGGIDGRKLKLTVIDNESKANKTAPAMRKMADNKIFIVIGAYSTAATLSLKPDAEKYKITVLAPTATNDVITERNDYVFRTCFSDSYQGKVLGHYAVRHRNLKQIGVLLNMDEDGTYSRDLGKAACDSIVAEGGKIVAKEGYNRNQTTYIPQLQKILDAGVDGIFIPCYQEEAATMIKEARELGYRGQIFGGDGWDEQSLFEKISPLPGKCFFSTMFSVSYDTKQTRRFLSTVREITRMEPSLCNAQGYDTVGIIAVAVKNSVFDSDIRKALFEIKDYPGVTGNITINKDRNAVKTIFIKEIVKLPSGYYGPEFVEAIEPNAPMGK